MSIRSVVNTLHLWLGLITGLIVVILGITGCINVFADQARHAIYPERYFVPVKDQKLPLSRLIDSAQQAVGEAYPLTRGRLYNIPGRSYEFRTLKVDESKFGFWNYYTWYYRIYVDPYTGKVITVEDAEHSFFDILLGLHTNLLLGRPLGKMIVRWAVICFVVLLISGLLLWWRKPAYKIKWHARAKRLNYDLHNILGFYALAPLLLIALTGLGMSFELIAPKLNPLSSDTSLKGKQPDDLIYQDALKRHPNAAFLFYNIPPAETGVITVAAYGVEGKFYDRIADRYDRWSGKRLETGLAFGDKQFNDQLKATDFDLHTGVLLGLPGRLLAFVASLIAAGLPITGFIFWLNKKKPKRQKTNSIQIYA